MNWEECKKKYIRRIQIDKEQIESIKETAQKRLKFLKTKEESKDNISFLVEGHYEIIKELLVTLLLKNGLKSKNHQCLISYFHKKHPEYEYEVNLILQMSYLRNRLNYYGEEIDIEFYEKNKEEFHKIIKILTNLINK